MWKRAHLVAGLVGVVALVVIAATLVTKPVDPGPIASPAVEARPTRAIGDVQKQRESPPSGGRRVTRHAIVRYPPLSGPGDSSTIVSSIFPLGEVPTADSARDGLEMTRMRGPILFTTVRFTRYELADGSVPEPDPAAPETAYPDVVGIVGRSGAIEYVPAETLGAALREEWRRLVDAEVVAVEEGSRARRELERWRAFDGWSGRRDWMREPRGSTPNASDPTDD